MVAQSLAEEVEALEDECAHRLLSLQHQQGVVVQGLDGRYLQTLMEELLGIDRLLVARKKHFEYVKEELDKLETEVRKRKLTEGVSGLAPTPRALV